MTGTDSHDDAPDPHGTVHEAHHDPHDDLRPLYPALPPEPPARRLRQYAFMFVCGALVVVFGVWLIWSFLTQRREAETNASAANKLCRQLVDLGQACAAAPANDDGVATQAAVPAPTAALSGTPLTPSRVPGQPAPTDENGVAQAYTPGEDALIVAVGVAGGRLILTFTDGARLDAGPVDEQTLSIVLRQVASASPSPVPSASPSPSPVPSYPPGADAPDPTDTPGGPDPTTVVETP